MTDVDPYEVPEADLQQAPSAQAFTLADTPASRPFGCGWSWIAMGFDYFRQSWGAWILAMLLGFVIIVVLSLIPVVGQLFDMLTYYVWIAGLALGCRAQAQGESFKVSHLWAGFTSHPGKLILLSVVVSIIAIVIVFGTIGLAFPQLLTEEGYTESADPRVVLLVLLGLLFFFPLAMAAFFAPQLIVFHDVPLFRAMKLSFIGCLKNILPFLLWGIIMLLLSLLAAIPLGLGMLVLIPVVNASTYVAYEEIFLQR
jgi:hypothetical protein